MKINKTDRIKRTILIASVFGLLVLIFSQTTWGEKVGSLFVGKNVYETAIMVRDQSNLNPREDAKTSLKRGDVLVVFPEGHNWSNTERISYLILKIRMTEDQANQLMKPKSEEYISAEGDRPREVIFKTRQYRIKIENLDFEPMDLIAGQPFAGQIFDWSEIVEEK